MKVISEKSRTTEVSTHYLIEFDANFASLVNAIQSYAKGRLKSLETRQRVYRRYEKKRRLQKARLEEEKVKIYGPKVKTINSKNYQDIQIDLTKKNVRHMM